MSINFSVNKMIYNDRNFSIAWGQWKDETMSVAMRWENDSDTHVQTAWFQLPEYFGIFILKGVLELKPSHHEEIEQVVNELGKSEKWDRQIEKDAESGKLDFLIEEALSEKRRGLLKDI